MAVVASTESRSVHMCARGTFKYAHRRIGQYRKGGDGEIKRCPRVPLAHTRMPNSDATLEATLEARLEAAEAALAAERARGDELEAKYQRAIIVLDTFVSYSMNVRAT